MLRNCFRRRLFCTSANAQSLNVCVVGSGPAGFYTTKYLLKNVPNARVSMLDALPTPYGLVRSGVAPDHADTKTVISDFSKVASDPRCRFLGNVAIGRDVSVADLRSRFHAVVLAYGAASDRSLDIPGEGLAGVHSARTFVNWYNGHPDYSKCTFDLSSDSAIVIGHGNVAVDCARILCSPIEKLRTTDISAHALEALEKSNIRTVYLVGRRGPVQAKFTNKELREVCEKIDGIATIVDQSDMDAGLNPESLKEMESSRADKKKIKILKKCVHDESQSPPSSASAPASSPRRIRMKFFLSPKEILPNASGHVQGVRFDRNTLSGPSGSQTLSQTGDTIDLSSGLVLKSIGYKALKVDGVPFDTSRGVIPSTAGRVEDNPGLYVSGWLKRGPSGIIGTNILDAQQTAMSIEEDLTNKKLGVSNDDAYTHLESYLHEKNVEYVNDDGWKRIDAEETRRGQLSGKPKEKIATVEEMIRIARAVS